ncbi:nuclear transport factor 2 family protein [Phyllobacterium sp. SB3]|uniref:nuclear transport factor 2 family protein n=1 Tax=Phyllobacterium sp. SB3 TaxID=3156073 RepID=UPI0032AFCBC1
MTMSIVFENTCPVLRDYFDALYFCDVKKLERVFHPAVIDATRDEASCLHRIMTEYVPIVAMRQSRASRNEAGYDCIDSIDQFAVSVLSRRLIRCTSGWLRGSPLIGQGSSTFASQSGGLDITANGVKILP